MIFLANRFLKFISGNNMDYLIKLYQFLRYRGAWGGVKRIYDIALKEGLTGVVRRIKGLNYSKWVKWYDTLNEGKRAKLDEDVRSWARSPKISVLMPTYNPNLEWFELAILAVQKQIYQNWELCIADDASNMVDVKSILDKFVANDNRIKVAYRNKNGHISAASNSALELVTGEWVALLDHDDILAEDALYWVAKTIISNPTAKLIYSDEDKIDNVGRRLTPYFKCDWNLDLFYSQNMFSHLGVYETNLVKKVGGFRQGYEGSQDYDLCLRCIEQVDPNQIIHIPRVLYHWRIHEQSTANSTSAKPYAILAGERALKDHFDRMSIGASVEYLGNGYRVKYELPKVTPNVSLIIIDGCVERIQKCIKSIQDKTHYSNYEILLIDYLESTGKKLIDCDDISYENVRVLKVEGYANLASRINQAVMAAKADIVGILSSDLEVIDGDWLSELVSHALRENVGCVGAKIVSSGNRIQNSGMIIGKGMVADDFHFGFYSDSSGYFGRASLTQSFSALSSDCLLINKNIYHMVDGFDENYLGDDYSDIDFCLKLDKLGYKNIWTPYAKLLKRSPLDKKNLGWFQREESGSKAEYMKKKWGGYFDADPAYSPNLTLVKNDFGYAWPPRGVDFINVE